MNKWLLTGIIIVIVLVVVGIMFDQGVFDNLSGGVIGMLIAGLAAPYMAIKNWIVGDKFRTQFREKYTQIEKEEKTHRVEYDQKILEKEKSPLCQEIPAVSGVQGSRFLTADRQRPYR